MWRCEPGEGGRGEEGEEDEGRGGAEGMHPGIRLARLEFPPAHQRLMIRRLYTPPCSR